ncbi:regakine-1 isoform X1 [Pangasianodon hypophthalmus]|uniref:regakine-1 isoform X1 n=1 Tax=Pangasianodon hypophthalmus TaxID=310915 RepID=UPI002307B24B|nr:regakine-1 isoform X1 [Pangasianodon hypophthalmus]
MRNLKSLGDKRWRINPVVELYTSLTFLPLCFYIQISSSHSSPSLCEIRPSARMRNLAALLFLLSLCSLHLVSSAPNAFDYKNHCCSGKTDVRIPKLNIKNYWWTSRNCSIKAIVFETKFNRTICVDPNAVWVSGHMKVVDDRKTSVSKP